MGIDNWNHGKFISHKVRNGSRRGYLQKTYYDKKLMQAKFSTGQNNTNDRIDILQPAGFLGRHPPSDKAELVTNDIGGDTSRRVCLGVIGDREYHPKIDEGESVLYSPSNKNNYIRIKGEKPKKQQGQGKHGSGAEFEDPYDGEGNEDKNPKGIHAASETNETHNIKSTFQVEAGSDVRIKAPKVYIKGDVHIDGALLCKSGSKPGNGDWGDGSPAGYPGAVQFSRELPPPEPPSPPVQIAPAKPKPYTVDAEGNVTFTGKVTFQGPVTFGGPVAFADVVDFAWRDE